MSNIVPGINFMLAKADGSFADLGFTTDNTIVIYGTDGAGNSTSWIPGRSINSLASIFQHKTYMIVSKTDYDNAGFEPPITAPEKLRANAFMYNLATVLAKSTGTVLTIAAVEPGATVPLGSYTTQAGDSSAPQLVAQLVGTINATKATTGYEAFKGSDSVKDDSFYVIARGGLGSSMNGQQLQINFSGGGVSANFAGGLD